LWALSNQKINEKENLIMADFLEAVVAGFTVVSLFMIVFGFVLAMRYFKYKERKAIAEANGRLSEKEPNDG
jgi:hypothetical protein